MKGRVAFDVIKKLLLPTLCLLASGLLPCRAETVIALTSDNKLKFFDSTNPGAFLRTVNITGIPALQDIVAMDFRLHTFFTGNLYLVTRETFNSPFSVRMYSVDLNSGATTQANSISSNWTGTAFGFDFTPGSSDAVLVSDTDKLQRVGPNGGFAPVTAAYDNTTSDGDPVDLHAGDNPAIVALASSNNFPEAASSVLYGIDSTPNSLVVVNRVTGELNTVGPLKAVTGTRCGFDISGTTGTAYAALSSGDTTVFYTVDLGTGAVTSVGTFPSLGSVTITDIAVLPPTRLVNISTRSRVGTGEEVMIAGFIADGQAPVRLIIRGLGPSLAAFGIASPIPNPFLSIRDHNGVEIASNNDWGSNQQSEISASNLAPTNDLEAAYIGNFAPGAYTAILSDVNNTTGIGTVEVYKLRDQ
jgi:hypothetical protein